MNNLNKMLSLLELSEEEADIYLYLLKSGPSLVKFIIVDLNLEKTAAYSSLNLLISKELVFTAGKERYKKYIASPPERLKELVDNKKDEISELESQINNLAESVQEYATQMYSKRNIEIIEGENAFEKWMQSRLEAKENTYIREISSNKHQVGFIKDMDKFKELSLSFPKERIKKNIKMKALMQKEDIDDFPHLKSVETTDKALLKEVRLLPENFKIEAGFQSYNNKSSFMREYQGDFLGIIIEDKFITSLLNNMFDLIFLNAKKA